MLGGLLMIAGGGGLGMLGLWQWDVARRGTFSVNAPQRRLARMSRRTLGLLLALLLGGGMVLLVPLLGLQGSTRLIALAAAGIMAFGCAVVLPRAPKVAEDRRVKAIRLALPAAITEWRIAAETGDTLPTVMQRYVAVPRPERAAIQHVIGTALTQIAQGARHTVTDPVTGQRETLPLRLSEALVEQARRSGCAELVATMTIIHTADTEGGLRSATDPLRRHGQILARVIEAEIDQLVTKRGLAMIGAAAPAVIGALVLILFVAAAGSTLDW